MVRNQPDQLSGRLLVGKESGTIHGMKTCPRQSGRVANVMEPRGCDGDLSHKASREQLLGELADAAQM